MYGQDYFLKLRNGKIQKLAQSRPEVGPKLSQSWPEVGLKSAQSRPKVGPKSAQSRPKVGPRSAQASAQGRPRSASNVLSDFLRRSTLIVGYFCLHRCITPVKSYFSRYCTSETAKAVSQNTHCPLNFAHKNTWSRGRRGGKPSRTPPTCPGQFIPACACL